MFYNTKTTTLRHQDILSPFNSEAGEKPKGMYDRMFPGLPPCINHPDLLKDLMQLASIMKGSNDHGGTPAGYTYLGQFIAHDMSFDLVSLTERRFTMENPSNYRTPALDLDSVYGGGPMMQPYLYEECVGNFIFRFNEKSEFKKGVLRAPKKLKEEQGPAIIPDPRNDENVVIEALHMAIMSLHNTLVKNPNKLPEHHHTPYEAFIATRKEVLKYYHWCILKDYLPRIVGYELISDILTQGRKYFKWDKKPYIPVEFSIAAFRFGHSQVSNNYNFNKAETSRPLFRKHTSDSIPEIDWRYFFPDEDNPYKGNKNKKIGPFIAGNILNRSFSVTMPVINDQVKDLIGEIDIPKIDEMNLAQRNLMRGYLNHLPSGQSVARIMGIEPLSVNSIGNMPPCFVDNTPLWYYLLFEAYKLKEGEQLGPVGGQIVAEVLIGLLESDAQSILKAGANWNPTDHKGQVKCDFNMTDLLKLAGVYE